MNLKSSELPAGLLVEQQGPVCLVTFDAAATRNAISDDVHVALPPLWAAIADDPTIGAVVLTGAGSSFSAGGEMESLRAMHDDPQHRRRNIREADRVFRSMMSCEVPIVAAVNGPAVGLGATLVLLCDLVVMAEDAFLSDPHVPNGVVAGDGGAVLWPLCMSPQRSKEYLFLGSRVPAGECERLGLANRVVAESETLPVALELAGRLAALPRQAVRDTKRAVNLHLRQAADTVLDFALAAEGESFAGDDVMATVRRFIKA